MKKGTTVVLSPDSDEIPMILSTAGSITPTKYYGLQTSNSVADSADLSLASTDRLFHTPSFNRAVTVKSISLLTEDPTGAETTTATLRVNGVDTLLVATVHGGNTFAVDNTHSAVIPQGQLGAIRIDASGGSASTQFTCAIEFI